MANDNNNEEITELQEHIGSIKNIGYFIYTWHRTIIICTIIAAIVGTLAIAFLGEWYNRKFIELGSILGVAVIIISIALIHIYCRKQYFIECENGKIILIVGGFRRFHKYYIDNSCYVIKKGQPLEIKSKERDSIKILFSEMTNAEVVKTKLGNQEKFSIKQEKEDSLTIGLGRGKPAKYGEMVFVGGKFKNGFYASTITMGYSLHFRIVQYDIKINDIVPTSILDLIENKH